MEDRPQGVALDGVARPPQAPTGGGCRRRPWDAAGPVLNRGPSVRQDPFGNSPAGSQAELWVLLLLFAFFSSQPEFVEGLITPRSLVTFLSELGPLQGEERPLGPGRRWVAREGGSGSGGGLGARCCSSGRARPAAPGPRCGCAGGRGGQAREACQVRERQVAQTRVQAVEGSPPSFLWVLGFKAVPAKAPGCARGGRGWAAATSREHSHVPTAVGLWFVLHPGSSASSDYEDR